jgi:drug/metabolite transporter (DMT)-like permease
MTRFRADLLLLLAAAIWGFAFVFQKTAMEAVGPFTFVAARGLLAALALAPIAIYEARCAPPLSDGFWRLLGLGSAAIFAAAALQQHGLQTASVTNAGFLTALYVILVPFLAWVALARPPAARVWPAAALSFAGTWMLGGAAISDFSVGDRMVLGSAVFWAVHVLVTSQAARFDRPMLFTALQFGAVGLAGLAFAAPTETISVVALWQAAPEILYVALMSSALTFTILIVAMRHTPVSEAAVIVSTENLFAALGGAWLLGERLAPINWVGAVLIFAATLLVQLPPLKR